MSSQTQFPPLVAESPPLRPDDGGIIRIGNSRVSLDVLVEQYNSGMSPEEFVRAYDSVSLADVHAAIGYYLHHQDEVEAYLSSRAQRAEGSRSVIEAARPGVSRSELRARRAARE